MSGEGVSRREAMNRLAKRIQKQSQKDAQKTGRPAKTFEQSRDIARQAALRSSRRRDR